MLIAAVMSHGTTRWLNGFVIIVMLVVVCYGGLLIVVGRRLLVGYTSPYYARQTLAPLWLLLVRR